MHVASNRVRLWLGNKHCRNLLVGTDPTSWFCLLCLSFNKVYALQLLNYLAFNVEQFFFFFIAVLSFVTCYTYNMYIHRNVCSILGLLFIYQVYKYYNINAKLSDIKIHLYMCFLYKCFKSIKMNFIHISVFYVNHGRLRYKYIM